MSNSQLSGAKGGSRHGALQPTSEPKDLLINPAVRFWGKEKNCKMRTKKKRVFNCVTPGHEIGSRKKKKSQNVLLSRGYNLFQLSILRALQSGHYTPCDTAACQQIISMVFKRRFPL